MKNFFKTIAVATVAAASVFAPTAAKAADNGDLLTYMEMNGIEVEVNGRDCAAGDIYGKFAFNDALTYGKMTLCPGQTVDQEDHETVIHETMHVVQACVNKRRGTSYDTPVFSYDELAARVNRTLPDTEVQWIKSAYPQSAWWVEFEAFYAEEVYDANDMIDMLESYCF